jgi:hypothetical protein
MIVWWFIALVEAALSLALVALDISAWAHDWTTGLVVSVIITALLSLIWGGMLSVKRDFGA